MNKRSLRAFSFGIFFSVSLIGAYYYGFDQKSVELDQKKAIQLLEDNQYVVLTKEKYNQLQNDAKQPLKDEKTKKNSTQEKKTEEKASKQQKKIYSYKLKIKSGMTSVDIASILESQEIIDNQDNFSQYLSESGYSTKIQLGEFKLTNDMSFNEIAKIITKS